jgi:hypothetical protein
MPRFFAIAVTGVAALAIGMAHSPARALSDSRVITRTTPIGPCTTVIVGNDISHGNTTFFTPLGHAANQVFFARDTLVSTITVWKPAQPDTLDNPMQLFITGTDSTFADSIAGANPNPLDMLLQGPIALTPN